MKKDSQAKNCCEGGVCCDTKYRGAPNNGAVYGLGFIGALVYFVGQSTTFWMGVVGILKAIVWPAYAVYFGLQALLS